MTRILFAGGASKPYRTALLAGGARDRLLSYVDLCQRPDLRADVMKKGLEIKLMLDSGAFSAWTQGLAIDIDEYIAFIKKNKAHIDSYVNLDVIAGKRGKKRTAAEIEEGARLSYKNLRYMKERGLTPLPVFHQGEDIKWLQRLLDDGEPYIGISPFKEFTTSQHIPWLDKVFTLLTDNNGKPRVKTHGFGVAGYDLLMRYPWTTCDSTTWAFTAAYGQIFVPPYRGGKPQWLQQPAKIILSTVARKNPGGSMTHYQSLGKEWQGCVQRFLREEVGITVVDAANDYAARCRAVITYFLRFSENKPDEPFRYRAKRFF